MSDRDLIAEGRQLAAHTADELPHIARTRDVLSAVADELERARARIAELEADNNTVREMYSSARERAAKMRARIAELERENIRLSGIEQLHAEQSPLGHVVVTFVEGREPFIHGDHRRVMTAVDAIRSVGRSDLPRGTTLKLCELREVTDRG